MLAASHSVCVCVPRNTFRHWKSGLQGWLKSNFVLSYSDSPRRSSVKIGTIQRRLAWPLRKDGTLNSRRVTKFFVARIRETAGCAGRGRGASGRPGTGNRTRNLGVFSPPRPPLSNPGSDRLGPERGAHPSMRWCSIAAFFSRKHRSFIGFSSEIIR